VKSLTQFSYSAEPLYSIVAYNNNWST